MRSTEERNGNEENKLEAFAINDEYSMYYHKIIGSGAFGVIYKGISTKTKQEYAFKLEHNNPNTAQLKNEYQLLKHLEGGPGLPHVHYIKHNDQETVMVLDLLGPNLKDILLCTKTKKFTLKSVLIFAEQMLSTFMYIHEKGVIHRDIKPENFVIGIQANQSLIYLIDFGLARRYLHSKTGDHIPLKEGKQLTGTARYVSIYTHQGLEQSRRDDLESLGYILVYFIYGELPWENIKSKTEGEKQQKILEHKLEFKAGNYSYQLLDEIKAYFTYVYSIDFAIKPNYTLLKGLISKLMTKYGYYKDAVFDWCTTALMETPIFMIQDINERKRKEREEEELKKKKEIMKESLKEDSKEDDNIGNKCKTIRKGMSSKGISGRISLPVGNTNQTKGKLQSKFDNDIGVKNERKSTMNVKETMMNKK